MPSKDVTQNRRHFLKQAGKLALAGAAAAGSMHALLAAETVQLPFENGERPLVAYPQKRPLLRLTARPPQLETPFSVFNESVLTPNDAFFVRYHLTNSPPPMEKLQGNAFRLQVKGKVNKTLSLPMTEIKTAFTPVEVVAVNQCSGNSRGFFNPRVPGGQLANGAMGNARWKGARLTDVIKAAGIAAGAKQVIFNGLDTPLTPTTPDFIKAIDIDQALDGEILLAYEMNGEDLPWLNGYPLRLVVPGFYGTYWVKHVNEITVIDEAFTGFWMSPAYRIPDTAGACVEPGTVPGKTIPINRFNVRSFITSVADGDKLKSGKTHLLRGIAFDGGHGITEVLVSEDGGKSWRGAELGKDLGRYSFREWTLAYTPKRKGAYDLKVKATNRLGQSQPMDPLWNPAGYMRNVVETVRIQVI
ncbi:MAG TPA: molybdopterin-dependent oxidoreductase [Roseimicrobium sp.]|nr:molybdopterin-dependent oxidoreductase [Roseimicrobium sp.]